jgi:hypothetical protein
MVTVTSYVPRTRKDGTTFIALEISGGLELIQSQTTGRFYASTKKTTIPSTFEESFAKTLIGTQLPGNIVRIQVQEYEYVNKRTGEVMKLNYSYSYQPEGSMELIGESKITELEMA